VVRQKCGLVTDVYSRVVGYFSTIKQWNKGKQEEFKDRKPFSVGGEGGCEGAGVPEIVERVEEKD
jgi:hypothetical protein